MLTKILSIEGWNSPCFSETFSSRFRDCSHLPITDARWRVIFPTRIWLEKCEKSLYPILLFLELFCFSTAMPNAILSFIFHMTDLGLSFKAQENVWRRIFLSIATNQRLKRDFVFNKTKLSSWKHFPAAKVDFLNLKSIFLKRNFHEKLKQVAIIFTPSISLPFEKFLKA